MSPRQRGKVNSVSSRHRAAYKKEFAGERASVTRLWRAIRDIGLRSDHDKRPSNGSEARRSAERSSIDEAACLLRSSISPKPRHAELSAQVLHVSRTVHGLCIVCVDHAVIDVNYRCSCRMPDAAITNRSRARARLRSRSHGAKHSDGGVPFHFRPKAGEAIVLSREVREVFFNFILVSELHFPATPYAKSRSRFCVS